MGALSGTASLGVLLLLGMAHFESASAHCRYQSWSSWSPCSVTCGQGTQTRTRKCSCSFFPCSGPSSDSQNCQGTGTIKTWSTWSSYSACSTTCGTGTSTRTRSCTGDCGSCIGESSDSMTCDAGAAKTWTTWGPYSGCSTACGIGTMTRFRSCIGCLGVCIGESSDSVTCNAGAPNAWTAWGPYSGCSVLCGIGTMTRSRTCTGCFGICSGSSTDSIQCTGTGVAKSWSTWSSYSACSTACGTGTSTRTRSCQGECGTCGTEADTDSVACIQGTPRSWSAWQPASECSTACGAGTQQFSRTCGNGDCGECPGDSTKTLNCSIGVPRSWTTWQLTQPCSTSCGIGEETWGRSCTNGDCGICEGATTSTNNCSAGPAYDWTPWQAAACSNPCGVGTQSRMRSCEGCVGRPCSGLDTDSVACAQGSDRTWSAWVAVGVCSTACGIGTLPLVRSCDGCVGSCEGPAEKTVDCSAGPERTWRIQGLCSRAADSVDQNFTQLELCDGCWGEGPLSCDHGQSRTRPCVPSVPLITGTTGGSPSSAGSDSSVVIGAVLALVLTLVLIALIAARYRRRQRRVQVTAAAKPVGMMYDNPLFKAAPDAMLTASDASNLTSPAKADSNQQKYLIPMVGEQHPISYQGLEEHARYGAASGLEYEAPSLYSSANQDGSAVVRYAVPGDDMGTSYLDVCAVPDGQGGQLFHFAADGSGSESEVDHLLAKAAAKEQEYLIPQVGAHEPLCYQGLGGHIHYDQSKSRTYEQSFLERNSGVPVYAIPTERRAKSDVSCEQVYHLVSASNLAGSAPEYVLASSSSAPKGFYEFAAPQAVQEDPRRDTPVYQLASDSDLVRETVDYQMASC